MVRDGFLPNLILAFSKLQEWLMNIPSRESTDITMIGTIKISMKSFTDTSVRSCSPKSGLSA
jgi:hypothetical protein